MSALPSALVDTLISLGVCRGPHADDFHVHEHLPGDVASQRLSFSDRSLFVQHSRVQALPVSKTARDRSDISVLVSNVRWDQKTSLAPFSHSKQSLFQPLDNVVLPELDAHGFVQVRVLEWLSLTASKSSDVVKCHPASWNDFLPISNQNILQLEPRRPRLEALCSLGSSSRDDWGEKWQQSEMTKKNSPRVGAVFHRCNASTDPRTSDR
eukprot:CAMPEP_0196758704 /NCGR_PEP_ID=MMETSP1091-20130531/104323_1 /TAXON_ID=302021 /ORGANISM="Rhodomonas sp., Strain CCMP768" /LENGTH=209 /DNA_ID=CAMNT_0042107535 /DNA_START=613 /DNA_END=1242 /DNA_ORIENTATION=+